MSDLYIFGYGSSGPSTIDISSATVTLGPSLTYSGTEQTQTVSSVVVNGKTLTENTHYIITDNTATNAGAYTLSVVGSGKYTGVITKNWSIAKAQGSISVSPSSLTIVGVNSIGTATITSVGDGAISAASSNTSVATVGVSGNTVTVTSVAIGSATVVVTMADGQNYLGDSASIDVSATLYDSMLANNTPQQIQSAAQEGIASTLWSVGATTGEISIGVVGNMSATSACAYIIGFNHNSSIEGTGIHFQFGKTVNGTNIAFCDSGYGSSQTSGTWFNMNNSNTNSGGWKSSRMRTVICPAFKSALPGDWQEIIVGTNKYTDNSGYSGGGRESAVTSTYDEIFLLADFEIYGSAYHGSNTSGKNTYEANYLKQYEYYSNGNSKLKFKSNATSTACGYYLRSPYYEDRASFRGVQTSGYDAFNSSASYSYGFAPAFRVA